MPSKNKSKGLELATNWTNKKKLKVNFNYTLTKSYAGMDCDKPEKDKWGYTSCIDSGNGWLEKAMVRVPIHAVSSKIDYQLNKNINTTVNIKLPIIKQISNRKSSYFPTAK